MGKNKDLILRYEIKKETMCGNIGQRKVKCMLNTLIKKGDMIASMYKVALEIENCNINAKKYHNTMDVKYKDKYYEDKVNKILELVGICQKYNQTNPNDKIIFGWQESNVRDTRHIIYFELPGMRQISFHVSIPTTTLDSISMYDKEWDGLVNSTLDKIEEAINYRYPDNLSKYKMAA